MDGKRWSYLLLIFSWILLLFEDVDAIFPTNRTLYPVPSNITLTCIYGEIMPDPESIFWNDLLGEILSTSSSENIVIDDKATSLIVEIEQDSDFRNRRYTCLLIDEESGNLTQDFFINFYPQPVVRLEAPMLSSMSITLMWEYQTNLAEMLIKTFIEVFNESNMLVTNMTIESDITTKMVNTLEPFTTYTLKVYSISLIGSSNATAITVVTLSKSSTCNVTFNLTKSRRSYGVNNTVKVACLQCGSSREWMITYKGMSYKVTNTSSPNATVVEVIDDILEVKNPIDQFVEGFYRVNVTCANLAYMDIKLYELMPISCDASYTTSMNKFEVLVDSSTSILCLACESSDGYFDPSTQWQILQENGTSYNIIAEGDVNVSQGLLVVKNPHKQLIKNKFFTSCKVPGEFYLEYRVYSTDFIPPSVPIHEMVREGSNTTIVCVNSNPTSFEIIPIWLDSNQLIVSRTLVLRLNPITRTDSGNYTCSLTNKDSQTRSSSVMVSVQFVHSTISSRIVIFPSKNILLSCIYNFLPNTPSYWENGTTKLKNDVDGVSVGIRGRETVLTVVPGEEERNLSTKLYKCLQIENGQLLSLIFYVSFYPEPVSDLLVYFAGKFSLSVSWKYRSNGSTARQSVDIELLRENIKIRNVSRDPALTNLILSNLSPGTKYTLKIFARNEMGRSEPTEVSAFTLNDPVPLILKTTIPLLFICTLSGLILLLAVAIFIRRWQVKERNRILSRKMEDGTLIEYETKEYKNKFSELVAKTKKKIIGEEVYRIGPKYITRGTDTDQDNRRESVLVQGLKFFPRRLSRVAGIDAFKGGDSRRGSFPPRKVSGPDDTPINLADRQRRRSTHVRRRSMAAAAAAYGPEGKPGDKEKLSGFYRKKSMAAGGKRKSIAGEVHGHKRRSITGAANWYDQKHAKHHGENDQAQVSHEHHRRRSSVHHRRKSIDNRKKSITGDNLKDDVEDEGKEHHRHHRRKSAAVDGEEGASRHRRKSTVVDGEEGTSRHRRKSTVVDGEEGTSRHRRKSTVVDGEEGTSRHRRKSTVVDGEEGTSRHRRKSTVVGEEGTSRHRSKSTVVDGEEGTSHRRRKSTVVDADVNDTTESEGKEHRHHKKSPHHRRKSNMMDADLTDTAEKDAEGNHLPRRSPYDRKKSTQVDADTAGNFDEGSPSGRSPYDKKKSTMVESEEWENSGQFPIDPALKMEETAQDEDKQQSKYQDEGEAHVIPTHGILKTPPPDYAIYSDLNLTTFKPVDGPSGQLGKCNEEDADGLISSAEAKSSIGNTEIPTSPAGEHQ